VSAAQETRPHPSRCNPVQLATRPSGQTCTLHSPPPPKTSLRQRLQPEPQRAPHRAALCPSGQGVARWRHRFRLATCVWFCLLARFPDRSSAPQGAELLSGRQVQAVRADHRIISADWQPSPLADAVATVFLAASATCPWWGIVVACVWRWVGRGRAAGTASALSSLAVGVFMHFGSGALGRRERERGRPHGCAVHNFLSFWTESCTLHSPLGGTGSQ